MKKKQGRIPHTLTTYNGKVYHSKSEARYAVFLDNERNNPDPDKKVVDIETQVVFPIVINSIEICKYLADFRVTYASGRIRVVDVKSTFTIKDPVYRIKKKAVEALYGIEIHEIILKK